MEKLISTTINQYTYRISFSPEDSAHIGRCLEFPSLASHGKTPVEALSEIQSVVGASIKWMKQEKEEIPEPLGSKKFSGHLSLRIPVDLHRDLALSAADTGVSLNQYILSKVAK